MIYFTAKSDLIYMQEFKSNILKFWSLHDEVKKTLKPTLSLQGPDYFEAVERKVNENKTGSDLREVIAKSIPNAIEIARKQRIGIAARVTNNLIAAGTSIPTNIISSMLQESSYVGVNHLLVNDKINEIIGQLEISIKTEYRKFVNPFYWVYELFKFCVRIPFIILSITGFNISQIEEHLISKIFKILEFSIILYILLKIGINKSDIVEILKELF